MHFWRKAETTGLIHYMDYIHQDGNALPQAPSVQQNAHNRN